MLGWSSLYYALNSLQISENCLKRKIYKRSFLARTCRIRYWAFQRLWHSSLFRDIPRSYRNYAFKIHLVIKWNRNSARNDELALEIDFWNVKGWNKLRVFLILGQDFIKYSIRLIKKPKRRTNPGFLHKLFTKLRRKHKTKRFTKPPLLVLLLLQLS